MVAASLSSCESSVQIPDFQFCAPIPGDIGASCNTFMSGNKQILTQQEWIDLQAQWLSNGQVQEVTISSSVGALKAAVEKLCSEQSCEQSAKILLLNGLSRMELLGKSNAKDKQPIK
jgi:hypothetical protein